MTIDNKGAAEERLADRLAWSIDEWCRLTGLSRSYYYKLTKDGRAPEAKTVGSRRIITREAHARWVSAA